MVSLSWQESPRRQHRPTPLIFPFFFREIPIFSLWGRVAKKPQQQKPPAMFLRTCARDIDAIEFTLSVKNPFPRAVPGHAARENLSPVLPRRPSLPTAHFALRR